MQCLGVCKVKKGCVALDIFIQMIKNIGEVIKIYTENYLIYTFLPIYIVTYIIRLLLVIVEWPGCFNMKNKEGFAQ